VSALRGIPRWGPGGVDGADASLRHFRAANTHPLSEIGFCWSRCTRTVRTGPDRRERCAGGPRRFRRRRFGGALVAARAGELIRVGTATRRWDSSGRWNHAAEIVARVDRCLGATVIPAVHATASFIGCGQLVRRFLLPPEGPLIRPVLELVHRGVDSLAEHGPVAGCAALRGRR